MMLNLVLVVSILWGFRLLLDAHRLIRKATVAIDRDQTMLDNIHEPEYLSLEEAEVIAVHVADMSREDALVAFIDAYDKRYSNDNND